jgi:hypothetical protein
MVRWVAHGRCEFIDRDAEHVIVPIHHRARSKSTGLLVEGTLVHLWTIRNGRVARFRSNDELDEALDAAAPPVITASPLRTRTTCLVRLVVDCGIGKKQKRHDADPSLTRDVDRNGSRGVAGMGGATPGRSFAGGHLPFETAGAQPVVAVRGIGFWLEGDPQES